MTEDGEMALHSNKTKRVENLLLLNRLKYENTIPEKLNKDNILTKMTFQLKQNNLKTEKTARMEISSFRRRI